MTGILGTALYAALAFAIVFAIIVPLQRLLAPHRPLPGRSDEPHSDFHHTGAVSWQDMVGLTFVLLVISPMAAAVATCAVIFLFGVSALILVLIGWLANFDLLSAVNALFREHAPSVVQGAQAWQILFAIFAISYIAFFTNNQLESCFAASNASRRGLQQALRRRDNECRNH
jgi:hypothetical protein